MFKTEIIKNVKDIDQRASMITDMINEQAKQGWDFQSAVAARKYSVILVFKKNAQHKLNEDFNKGISKVKNKVNKVVDAIKSKE